MNTPSASPRIVVQPSRPQLNKEQKRFNTLMEKLETRRALLQQWLAAWTPCEQIWTGELIPLFKEQEETEVERVLLLDQAKSRSRACAKSCNCSPILETSKTGCVINAR